MSKAGVEPGIVPGIVRSWVTLGVESSVEPGFEPGGEALGVKPGIVLTASNLVDADSWWMYIHRGKHEARKLGEDL